jgi:hypothetical protein
MPAVSQLGAACAAAGVSPSSPSHAASRAATATAARTTPTTRPPSVRRRVVRARARIPPSGRHRPDRQGGRTAPAASSRPGTNGRTAGRQLTDFTKRSSVMPPAALASTLGNRYARRRHPRLPLS